MHKFLKNKTFIFSSILLLPIILMAAFGPLIAPYDPLELHSKAILKTSAPGFLLGTDEFGRDILSRLVIGIRPSLIVAAGSTLFALVIGLIMGISAGYFGKKVEQLIMRLMDLILCFPPILLALLIVGFLGAGVRNLIITIGILYVPHFARLSYASTLQVKRQEFIEAELSLGASSLRVIRRGILPNIMSPIIIQISLTVGAAILLESGLSFLGLGVVPPEPSWGQMIGEARGYLSLNPMYAVWPSICLGITILSINLLGDSLRDILDPRLHS